jgi:hypothetical protein
MAGLAIAYSAQSGGGSWNIVFTDFTSRDLPRSFENSAGFGRSQTGALIQSGPRYEQKYSWTVDCMIDCEYAKQLEKLYVAWDKDRARGKSVAVGITDATFGDVVTGQATFTAAPTFTYASPQKVIVSFGLMGV